VGINGLKLGVRFFQTATGAEPVLDWLREQNAEIRKAIGTDIKTVQIGWPLGMPVVRKMERGLWEVRSHFSSGIARVLFTVVELDIVLLHGLSRNPKPRRRLIWSWPDAGFPFFKVNLMSNSIGTDFDAFLAEEQLLEEVTAAALKRVVAWQICELMKAQRVSKSALAQRMQTSRTVVARVLDSDDAGLTIATLANAARALGQRVEIRFVPEGESSAQRATR